ncbi:MAG: cyclic lactone autoinducer peptide [Clostridia bacterium]|nr:cyclic lactone autoinducer peptide [Clostridia bacterium]
MKNRIAKMLAAITLKVAKSAGGSASDWNMYQPKEPETLKKIMKK